ncbi:MAG TPA: phosphate ABC transporter permease PstA [Cytophagaceae bacterium]|jgi:phosphate transport system permease protein|nr:phosphate ABC transporter permease PstA [Cytophagaceae bacterium]
MKGKFIEEKIFIVLMQVCTLVILSSLILILASILIKGLPSISWEMISQTPQDGYYTGKGGGVLNAIVGSIYLAGGATLLAFFISLPVVLYLNIYKNKKSTFVNFTRLCLDVLWGIPSIVYGAFGFTIMLLLGIKTSLLAGIITVSLLVIPIMIRAMDEVIKTVPKGLLDASYSLGATRLETSVKVVIKQVLPGIITAILISFGRAVGDAASVLFTAGYTDRIPGSLMDRAATLPLAIFFQLGTPVPEVQERAYASALILTVMILIISLLTRYITKRYLKNKI